MKRLYSFFTVFGIIALLSSCNLEDINQSMVLSGEWRGDFGMYYTYVDRYGLEYTFDSYNTYLTFYPEYDYATYGWGKQVDYYEDGPYEYQYYEFSWSVDNGVLTMHYDYDHNLDTRISDYHMTNDYFTGTFFNTGTGFRLYKITDYYDWTPYVDSYGFGSRNNWGRHYAAGTRADAELADSVTVDSIASSAPAEEEGKVIARGRRSTPLKQ